MRRQSPRALVYVLVDEHQDSTGVQMNFSNGVGCRAARILCCRDDVSLSMLSEAHSIISKIR